MCGSVSISSLFECHHTSTVHNQCGHEIHWQWITSSYWLNFVWNLNKSNGRNVSSRLLVGTHTHTHSGLCVCVWGSRSVRIENRLAFLLGPTELLDYKVTRSPLIGQRFSKQRHPSNVSLLDLENNFNLFLHNYHYLRLQTSYPGPFQYDLCLMLVQWLS